MAASLITQYVSMLERSVNQPSLHTIVMLATGLGVDAADLVADIRETLRARATE